MTDGIEHIEREFKAGDLEYIDAIERLQRIGMNALDAEAMVEKWGIDGGNDKN